jgi:hypothetical protein
MVARTRSLAALGCVALVLLVSVPVSAQIGDAISAYTDANAEGYLEPLARAIGANLNSALFHSAHVPEGGLHISLELGLMAVLFSEDDETFMATTEMGFSPETTVEASTVVGPIDAIIVPGDGGTTFAFPGGFDLASFALAAPQIRIGSFKGTEAIIRYLVYDTGDIEIGDVDVQGYGLRHSISQYIPGLPVDIAAGFMYQSFKLDEGLIDATSFSFGAQASMKLPLVFAALVGHVQDGRQLRRRRWRPRVGQVRLPVDRPPDARSARAGDRRVVLRRIQHRGAERLRFRAERRILTGKEGGP